MIPTCKLFYRLLQMKKKHFFPEAHIIFQLNLDLIWGKWTNIYFVSVFYFVFHVVCYIILDLFYNISYEIDYDEAWIVNFYLFIYQDPHEVSMQMKMLLWSKY